MLQNFQVSKFLQMDVGKETGKSLHVTLNLNAFGDIFITSDLTCKNEIRKTMRAFNVHRVGNNAVDGLGNHGKHSR